MFCNKEEFIVELSRKIILWQIFIGHRSAWFPLLSACRLLDFDTSAICLAFMYCLGLFLPQDMLLSLHKFAFRGIKPEVCREHVAYLHS